MAKVKAGNIDTGIFLMLHGQPHKVIKKKFVSPGKGSAFTRTKLQNLRTGAVVEHVFKSHDTVEEVAVDSKRMQFLYKSGDQIVFMDPRTYDQVEVPAAVLGEKQQYLIAGIDCYVMIYQGEPLAVSLPPKVTLEVKEAQEAVAGDRSNAGTKPAVMETGLKVQVPLFIKRGEKLIIDTDSGEYVSRA